VIVTRQRRKPFPWRRLILPLIAIALVVFAFSWGPSRNVITGGPMGPLWNTVGSTFDKVATPFHFAAQNQLITDRNKQILALQNQVADLQTAATASKKTAADLNAQIGQLQQQLASAHNAPSAAPGASSAPGALASPGAAGATANDLTTGATADMRRTAQYWANMEPDNLAKVLPKLPIPYVARVLALMSPDNVGAILDALPAAYVAQLTSENPELKR
jgi:hypothetical protein